MDTINTQIVSTFPMIASCQWHQSLSPTSFCPPLIRHKTKKGTEISANHVTSFGIEPNPKSLHCFQFSARHETHVFLHIDTVYMQIRRFVNTICTLIYVKVGTVYIFSCAPICWLCLKLKVLEEILRRLRLITGNFIAHCGAVIRRT